MALGNRSIVETENSFDHRFEFRRNLNCASATSICASWICIGLERHPKGFVKSRDGASKNDATARRTLSHYIEVVFLCKPPNERYVLWVSTVLLFEVFIR